jgi:hypothetical protein
MDTLTTEEAQEERQGGPGVTKKGPVDTLWRTRNALQAEIEQGRAPALQAFQGPELLHSGEPIDEADLDLKMAELMRDPRVKQENESVLQAYRWYRTKRREKPFQYLPVARQRRRTSELREQLPFLETILSGSAGLKAALGPEQYAVVERSLAGAEDPEAEKRKIANRLVYAAFTGQEANEDLWSLQRDGYARLFMGWEEQREIDEDSFYQLARKQLSRRRADAEQAETLYRDSRKMAIQSRPMSDALEEASRQLGARAEEFHPVIHAAYAGVLGTWSDEEIKASRAIFEHIADGKWLQVEKHATGNLREPSWMASAASGGSIRRAWARSASFACGPRCCGSSSISFSLTKPRSMPIFRLRNSSSRRFTSVSSPFRSRLERIAGSRSSSCSRLPLPSTARSRASIPSGSWPISRSSPSIRRFFRWTCSAPRTEASSARPSAAEIT